MKYIAIALLALSSASYAADAPVDPIEMQGRMSALEAQRNENANQVVLMNGKLSQAAAEIERLKKAPAECKPEDKK